MEDILIKQTLLYSNPDQKNSIVEINYYYILSLEKR